ncbi:MAG: hypothetical protein PHS94_02370 [Erysipelotrichaceae bacterium]|nr:hypothetical protein [Erysipelotrichaceae bacterium]
MISEYGLTAVGVLVTFVLLQVIGQLLGGNLLYELVRIKADCMFL